MSTVYLSGCDVPAQVIYDTDTVYCPVIKNKIKKPIAEKHDAHLLLLGSKRKRALFRDLSVHLLEVQRFYNLIYSAKVLRSLEQIAVPYWR